MLKMILFVVLIAVVPSDSTLLKKLLLKKAIAAKLGTPFLLRSLLTGESLLPRFGLLGGANGDADVVAEVVPEVVPEVDATVPIDTYTGDQVVPEVDAAVPDIGDTEILETAEPIIDESYSELNEEEEQEEEKQQEDSSTQSSGPSHYFVPIRSYTFTYPYPYSYAYRRAEPSYAYGAPWTW